MTRHPSARRVHRGEASVDDAFVAGVLESTAWAQKHRTALIIGGVSAVLAFLLLFVIMNSRSTKRDMANQQLTQLRSVVGSGNNQLAIRDAEQFLASYGSTPAAAEARLMLARAYLQEGQSQKAIETLRGPAGDVGNIMGVNAAFLLAAAHEAAKETERAEEVYLRVADDAAFLYQRQEALDNAARLRLARGNAAGAVQLYERILSITPEDDGSRQVFELRVGEARAAASAGTPAASGN